MEARRASGDVFHPWGTDVRGRLTYDGAGGAALQIDAAALRRRAGGVPDAVGALPRMRLDSGSILRPID
jgi:hypothetical protein